MPSNACSGTASRILYWRGMPSLSPSLLGKGTVIGQALPRRWSSAFSPAWHYQEVRWSEAGELRFEKPQRNRERFWIMVRGPCGCVFGKREITNLAGGHGLCRSRTRIFQELWVSETSGGRVRPEKPFFSCVREAAGARFVGVGHDFWVGALDAYVWAVRDTGFRSAAVVT